MSMRQAKKLHRLEGVGVRHAEGDCGEGGGGYFEGVRFGDARVMGAARVRERGGRAGELHW